VKAPTPSDRDGIPETERDNDAPRLLLCTLSFKWPIPREIRRLILKENGWGGGGGGGRGASHPIPLRDKTVSIERENVAYGGRALFMRLAALFRSIATRYLVMKQSRFVLIINDLLNELCPADLTCPPKAEPLVVLEWRNRRRGETNGQEGIQTRTNHRQTA
jgi:hypothetical protein